MDGMIVFHPKYEKPLDWQFKDKKNSKEWKKSGFYNKTKFIEPPKRFECQ